MSRLRVRFGIGHIVSALFVGAFASVAHAANDFIIVQSTTSTQNSGLYDYMLPRFERQSGIDVRVVAVGTGQALNNAARGDGDVLIVHATSDEEKFVAQGYGLARYDLMYNDYVLIGPKDDPARIADSADVIEAMAKIAATKSTFTSRSDDSGTHKKELALWRSSRINPEPGSGSWYLETGSGMGATLNVAVNVDAYVLSDRGTWIQFANKGRLKILYEGDTRLFNQYGVILVNPRKHPHVKAELGRRFVDWLLSDEGQSTIAAYRIDGNQLFFPNAN